LTKTYFYGGSGARCSGFGLGIGALDMLGEIRLTGVRSVLSGLLTVPATGPLFCVVWRFFEVWQAVRSITIQMCGRYFIFSGLTAENSESKHVVFLFFCTLFIKRRSST